MQEKVEKMAGLLDKYLKEELSPEEQSELESWIAEDERNGKLFKELTDKILLSEKLKRYAGVNSERVWQKTLAKIGERQGKVIEMPKRRVWIGYVAAAVVIGLVAGFGWYYFKTDTTKVKPAQPEIVTNTPSTDNIPGSNKAVLTLVDGKKIALSGNKTGTIPMQGTTEVSVTGEGLVYTTAAGTEGANGGSAGQYNTVTTPVGGQYQLTLPDGSKVWLNAASSLRFPIAFAGNERLVQLTGEAYFEVVQQKNATGNNKVPFIVQAAGVPESREGCAVEVLGTRFNIMAYEEEGAIQTTLLEGSVRITKNELAKTITPGQQAIVTNHITIKPVDGEDIIVWRNGLLVFNGASVQNVMRQIARWYDVSIEYEGEVQTTHEFQGKLYRTAGIEYLVKVLNASGIVHAKLEDKKIIVTP